LVHNYFVDNSCHKKTCKSISRILYPTGAERLPFIWPQHYCYGLAAYPSTSNEQFSGADLRGITAHKVYPKIFSRIHPKFKTPYFSTILTGLLVAIPALFLNLNVVLALTSIGTLFAFVLVCAGVLVLDSTGNKPLSGFKVPYINGKYIVPGLIILVFLIIGLKFPEYFISLFSEEGLPMLLFFSVCIIVALLAFKRNYSLIPVAGLLSCLYLMAQESHTNWYRFLIWLGIGLVVYFLYGRHHSKLANPSLTANI
jgi:amino acid transporter